MIENPFHHEHKHQGLLAHLVSYAPAIFFGVMVVGVVLHIFLPVRFVPEIVGWIVGVILLLAGPLIVLFAQRSRHTLYVPVSERTCFNFNVGPYRFSRHPTYLGQLFMLIGLSFLIDSLPMLVVSVLLVPLFTWVIIPMEEALLEKLCGDVYEDYKKRVRMWI